MKYLAILLLFIYSNSSSQSIDSYFLDEHPKGHEFDSLIQSQISNQLTASYFVITYPTIGATTSWVPQLLRAYNTASKFHKSIVLLLYNSGGFRQKDIATFLTDNCHLTQKQLSELTVVVDSQLYMAITQNRHLVRLQYYFRGNLLYNEAEKWHNSNELVLPTEKVNLLLKSKIKLKQIDKLLIQERDLLYPYNNNFLLLTNSKNELLFIDSNDGKVTSSLNVSEHFNASELYCNYMARGDSSKCVFAKSHQAYLDSMGRKTIMLDYIKFLGNDTLFMALSIEAMERSTEEYNFINDEGVRVVIKKGDPSLNLFSFLAFYDIKTKKLSLIRVNELEPKRGEDKYIMLESGTMVRGNKLITAYRGFGKKDNNSIGLMQLAINNEEIQPTAFLKPDKIVNDMLYMYYDKSYFYNFNGIDYFSYNCSNNIYRLGINKPVGAFFGNGYRPYEKEVFSDFFENNDVEEKERINYKIHAIQPILNGEYLAAYINYKGKPILEIKNRMLKTVDIIDLMQYPEIAHYHANKYRYDLIINDDKIIVKTMEDDEIYLNTFEISPIIGGN